MPSDHVSEGQSNSQKVSLAQGVGQGEPPELWGTAWHTRNFDTGPAYRLGKPGALRFLGAAGSGDGVKAFGPETAGLRSIPTGPS
jgi:hypothetical protein